MVKYKKGCLTNKNNSVFLKMIPNTVKCVFRHSFV